jgi:hypothetical protein
MLTAERLRELLDYDPLTGVFLWKVPRAQVIKAGDLAGTFCAKGYRKIIVDGRSYKAHRLAWLYVYGEWPADQIDHINRVKDDNRIANLRSVTNGENRANTLVNRNNPVGEKNVRMQNGKFRVVVRRQRKMHHVGYFESVAEAAMARDAWLQNNGDFR